MPSSYFSYIANDIVDMTILRGVRLYVERLDKQVIEKTAVMLILGTDLNYLPKAN